MRVRAQPAPLPEAPSPTPANENTWTIADLLNLDEPTLAQALADIEREHGTAARRELEELLAAEADVEDPAAFLERLVPTEPPPGHTRLLIDFFRRARHEQLRECHSMPPRHGKTVTIMRCVAWWIVTNPADTCAYVTYSADQARSKSRIIRELVRRAGVPLMRGSANLKEWRTEQGGGLVADGAMGGLTGKGFQGVVVFDDPYKSLLDAASPRARQKIQELFEAAIATRLEGASILVMHTRWDVNDLIGWLAKEKKWRVINIEAIAPDVANDNLAEPDPLGRAPGEALWPEVYPATRCKGPCGHNGHLDDIREQVGPYVWAALYCGRPPRRGGAVFGDPTQYQLAAFKLHGHRVGIGGDCAVTAKTSADYSVLIVGAMIGVGTAARLYILDVVRRQVELPDLVRLAMPLTEQWPGAPLFIEATGVGAGVPQTIRDVDATMRQLEHERAVAAWREVNPGASNDNAPAMPPPRISVTPVYPTTDKLLRAQPVAAAYLAGRVLIPSDAPWAAALIAELRAFTGVGDVHDDQVDALAHLWNGLFRDGGGGVVGGILTADDFPSYVGEAEADAA